MVESFEKVIVEMLHNACKQDPATVQHATDMLIKWEKEPSFIQTLVGIFLDTHREVNVRWMAVVYLKNVINNCWDKDADSSGLSKEAKSQIRAHLLFNINEPVSLIASQMDIVIASIARYDCPYEWPELLPMLINSIQNPDDIRQQRALHVLHQVVKTLASMQTTNDKKIFEKIATSIYDAILNAWNESTHFLKIENVHAIDENTRFLEKATISLKILKRLTLDGFRDPNKSESCKIFLDLLLTRITDYVEYRNYLAKNTNECQQIRRILEKFILKHMKILSAFINRYPVCFLPYNLRTLQVAFSHIYSTDINSLFSINSNDLIDVCVLSFNIMRKITDSQVLNIHATEELESTTHVAINEFFSNDRLVAICEKLILYYFVLTGPEMELWDRDPETFITNCETENWKYSLRSSAEAFIGTLFHHFRNVMTSEVSRYIKNAQEMTLTRASNIRDVLLTDAIYNVAGLAAFNLFDEIDFDSWCTHQLVEEISIKTNLFRIIRRRCVWLIGKWSGVKLLREFRPKIYELCLTLLQQNEDLVVRFEASKTLKTVLDDFEFEPQQFTPFVDSSLFYLFALLKEIKECETKMNVLNTISFVIYKMCDYSTFHVENIIEYLPSLWMDSGCSVMLQCAVISTLVHITRAICDIPTPSAAFLHSVIDVSTNLKSDCHVYLIDEGLELWLTVMENTTELSTELLDLSQNLFPILEHCNEHLRVVLNIIEAYIALSPCLYLQRYGNELLSVTFKLINNLNIEEKVMLLKVFETCLKADASISIELVQPILPYIFREICESNCDAIGIIMHLAITARVLILNTSIFQASLYNTAIPDGFERILDMWLMQAKFTHSEKRKLFGLALGSVITIENDSIYQRSYSIIQTLADCLREVMRENAEGDLIDVLFMEDESDLMLSDNLDYKTHHSKRLKLLCLKDPVYTIVLKDYLRAQMETLHGKIGHENFILLMSKVHNSKLFGF